MNTRDVRPPLENSKGDVSPHATSRAFSRASHGQTPGTKEKTPRQKLHVPPLISGRKSTGDIRQITKKNRFKDLLLIASNPYKSKPFSLGFILIIILVGTIMLCSLLILTVATRRVKTVDFYFDQATSGARRLVEGANLFAEHKFDKSADRFSTARATLESIDRELWFIPLSTTLNFSIDERMQTVRSSAKAALELAIAGEKTSLLASTFTKQLAREPLKNDNAGDTQVYPTTLLKNEKNTFESIAINLQTARNLFDSVSPNVFPANFQDEFSKAQTALTSISNIAKQTLLNFDGILEFIGDKKPHTILVMLQNASELRPTGGFVGNMAFLQFSNGKLTQQEVRDIYYFDHKLTEQLEPPAEIKLINSRWFMRDANSSLDFPTSARNIANFLKKEGGPEVDTIVTIDQKVVKDLLTAVGPLKIDELPTPLTGENFEQVLSFIVEAKIYGNEDPKVLLRSLLPALQKTLVESDKMIEVAQVLAQAVKTKHIMAYSVSRNVTKLIDQINASGKAQGPMANSAQSNKKTISKDNSISDFFGLAHYSIGGNKSDLYMREAIAHDTYIHEDGSVINEVKITRTNTWNRNTEQRLRNTLAEFGFNEIPPHVLTILGKAYNIHMLRVYAPKDSVLLDNNNPNVTTHFDSDVNATYFSVRLEVAAGDSNSISLRYKLPFTTQIKQSLLSPSKAITYELNLVKQPGQDGVIFKKRLFPPNGMKAEPTNNVTIEIANDSLFSMIIH